MIQIKKAVRERVYLKLVVTGPSGAGKTLGSIKIAKGLSPNGKVLVIDTENRSASYYAGRLDFDVAELEAPFTTQKYLEGLQAAIDGGYEAVVIDSLTHEWAASGGILDQKASKDARGGNSFSNWNEMKQLHNKFTEKLLQSHIHVVCTLRSKMEYALEQDDKGKSSVRKIGLAPISSDGMEYEFGVMFDVERNSHLAIASKDRTGLFEGRNINLDESVGKELAAWLATGGSPEPTTKAPATAPKAAASPSVKVGTQATQPRAQSVAQPVAQAATLPPEWVAAMTELAAVTVDMPKATRAALMSSFEADGPEALPALLEEIAKLTPVLNPETHPAEYKAEFHEQIVERTSELAQERYAKGVPQEIADFVDDLDPRTDESDGGISGSQYGALNAFINAYGINRDALRSYMAKAGHLLPGKNGPTLSRMKAEEFVSLRSKLTNQKIAAKGETWSARTVRIINATPITTFQPIPAAS